jgi:predicted metal-dependent hydrolase
VLNHWYRQLLRERIPELVTKWEPKVGVRVADWGIRRMKTKWGSCNDHARRIWINLELAKKPLACLEFVLVHEMVHLLERHHNVQFVEHMDRLMPLWRASRAELNRSPLSHEQWEILTTGMEKG